MSDLLVIALFAVFWYGLVPVIGAFITRASWRRFRRRFDALRLCPMLDYATYERYSRELSPEGGRFRFIGGFESITSNQASRTAPTLWIRAHNLTIPVGLLNARIYLLPLTEQEGREDQSTLIPQRIRWDRVSTLTEGARVFVGGMLALRDDRLMFVATRENPLILIFYDGDDRSLTIRAIRAGRHKNEYWNRVTPYAFILGVFTQLIIALSFLARPAFRFTAVAACIALFIPLFPVVPPGVLFTVVYQRLWRRARRFRAYRDIARLPLKYCANRLPDGERYGASSPTALPDDAEGHIPILIPASRRKKDGWYIFGRLLERDAGVPNALPTPPNDPFAPFGALPGNPELLARSYTIKARLLEVASWLFLLTGILMNLIFLLQILSVLLK